MRALPSINTMGGLRLGESPQDLRTGLENLMEEVYFDPCKHGIISYKKRNFLNEDFTNKQTFLAATLEAIQAQTITFIGRDNFEGACFMSILSELSFQPKVRRVKAYAFLDNPTERFKLSLQKRLNFLKKYNIHYRKFFGDASTRNLIARGFSNELFLRNTENHHIFGRALMQGGNQLVCIMGGMSEKEAFIIFKNLIQNGTDKEIVFYCQEPQAAEGLKRAVAEFPKIKEQKTYLERLASMGGSTVYKGGLVSEVPIIDEYMARADRLRRELEHQKTMRHLEEDVSRSSSSVSLASLDASAPTI
jgi:hypothetical protein